MRHLAVVVVLLSSSVAAADVPIHRIVTDDGTLVADTPSLQLAIGDAYRATAAKHGTQWNCSYTEATSVLVSWSCSGVVDNGPYTGGSFHADEDQTFAIEGGELVPIDWKKMWAPTAAARLAKVAGTSSDDAHFACSLAVTDQPFVTQGGLAYPGDDHGRTCNFAWEDIAQAFAANTVLARLAAAETAVDSAGKSVPMPGPTGAAPPARTAAGRFVADGSDAVRDTQTGLTWAVHDNGADIDAAAAAAWAKAYRGGGHADWRLPTIDELAAISAADLAHKNKGDCTAGKNQILISPLIQISCGLAWSSTISDRGQSAFGFISGSPRVAKPTDKKNYRALVVRKP